MRQDCRAWEISHDLNHASLQSRVGPVYLLDYLEQRLGRNPIPELGSRLEDFGFGGSREPEWCWASELRESYRRLQRALACMRNANGGPTLTRTPRTSLTSSSPKLPFERRRSTATGPDPDLRSWRKMAKIRSRMAWTSLWQMNA